MPCAIVSRVAVTVSAVAGPAGDFDDVYRWHRRCQCRGPVPKTPVSTLPYYWLMGGEGQIASIWGLSRARVVAGPALNFLLATVMALAGATIMVACGHSTVRWDKMPS
jgi:hypothetical protein